MAATLQIKYYNSFWLKKINDLVVKSATNIPQFYDPVYVENLPKWYDADNGAGGIDRINVTPTPDRDWYIEESRIRGGYNNVGVDLGVKAYAVEEETQSQIRSNSLIYSGIYNSRTGINNTNQFSVGEDITKSLDPRYNSIQLLYAEDTNLTIFQEDKVSRALIDKDAIYSAEGSPVQTSSNLVIGQVQAYAGEFGISTDPESFAFYGFRKYFTDRRRNAVLRLSRDGITEIQNYGMTDFFRDGLSSLTSSSRVVGGYDIHNKKYDLSIQTTSEIYKTLGFDDSINGWVSFYTYKPDFIRSLKNKFYSFKDGAIWQHYATNVSRGSFYGTEGLANVTFIFNPNVSAVKTFKTLNYEGSDGWKATSIFSNVDEGSPISKYVFASTIGGMEQELFTNSFKKKEDKYFASINNVSTVNPGEILFGNSISGIKGFYTTITMSVSDSSTSIKELFAVSSEYVESSY